MPLRLSIYKSNLLIVKRFIKQYLNKTKHTKNCDNNTLLVEQGCTWKIDKLQMAVTIQ